MDSLRTDESYSLEKQDSISYSLVPPCRWKRVAKTCMPHIDFSQPLRKLFPTPVRATDPRLGTKSLPAQRCCGIFSLVLEATCLSFLQRCVPYHFNIVVHIPDLAHHLACSAHRGHLRPARRVLELLGCFSLSENP